MLLDLLDPSARFVLVDVGARGGVVPAWRPLAPRSLVVAFDPDNDGGELAARSDGAPESGGMGFKFLQVALAETNASRSLFITRKADCSSLYRPNMALLTRYAEHGRFDVVRMETIQVRRLDAVMAEAQIASVDFIKVDVQGAELSVLRGAGRLLERCLGIQAEVEFSPLYLGQPLFGDLDRFAVEAGFRLFDLQLQRWCRKNLSPQDAYRNGKQVVWGDVVYLRDFVDSPKQLEVFSPSEQAEVIVKTAELASAYGFPDYGLELLTMGRERGVLDAALAERLIAALDCPLQAAERCGSGGPGLVRKMLATFLQLKRRLMKMT